MQICGRDFSPTELDWIRHQVKNRPDLNRAQLSRLFCSHTGWVKPDGGLKQMSCRVAMLRLERAGLIGLSAPTTKPVTVKKIPRATRGQPQDDIHFPAGRVDLAIEPVDRKKACDKPVKTIWLYPLDPRFKERLCQ